MKTIILSETTEAVFCDFMFIVDMLQLKATGAGQRDEYFRPDVEKVIMARTGIKLPDFFRALESPENQKGMAHGCQMEHFRKTFRAILSKKYEIEASFLRA